jgi:tRNA nucleotidyltransferase/poly(A) polymerase
MSDFESSDPRQEDDLKAYAYRWVALLRGRVIGHGGTPEQALIASRASRHKEKPDLIYVRGNQTMNFSDLLKKVVDVFPADAPVYLVGGAVRDAMLRKAVHDMDFVLPGETIKVARQTAAALNAAFYPLDQERETARVIYFDKNNQRVFLDFATFRGPDLESDLRGRDFTINAMAVNVRQPTSLLDPLGGAADLRSKLIKACSHHSFTDDPLRILRAVRFAAGFNFHIELETRQAMRSAVKMLVDVSPERVRDELFRILDGPQPYTSIRALEMLSAVKAIMPELAFMKGVEQPPPHQRDVWNHTLSVMQNLEDILFALAPDYHEESAANLNMGLAVLHLGRFRQEIGEHLKTFLNPDRSLRSLLFFAALYHDAAKPQTRSVEESGLIRFLRHEQEGVGIAENRAKALRLSSSEVDRLKNVVRNHMRPAQLARDQDKLSRRAIYRFFYDTGSSGIDICLISLADFLGKYEHSLPIDKWVKLLVVVRELMESWWDYPQERISPPVLINGRELMAEFNLPPGPLIGDLLEAVKEAQAIGEVNTREEAAALIKNKLRLE